MKSIIKECLLLQVLIQEHNHLFKTAVEALKKGKSDLYANLIDERDDKRDLIESKFKILTNEIINNEIETLHIKTILKNFYEQYENENYINKELENL